MSVIFYCIGAVTYLFLGIFFLVGLSLLFMPLLKDVREDCWWGPAIGGIFLVVVSGFMLWTMHGDAILIWLQTSPGMFGKSIGGYEQQFLDEQYPPKWEGDKLLDCWEWRHRKEDGVYVVPIKVSKPLDYFSEYHLHLLPISKRSFLISGNRFYATKNDYDEVKDLLTSKYGKPIEEKGNSCSFRDGDKKIGLVFTNVLGGKPQLYINAYRADLLEKDMPEEIRQLEALRKQKKMESL